MNTKPKGKVSLYRDASDTTSQNFVELDDILTQIRQPPEWIARLTQELNRLFYIDKDAYREEKRRLPMFCASGCFSYRNGNLSNLIGYSNILILDFDWDEPDPAEIEAFREQLIHYATPLHLYAIWKSPAKGIKAALLHNNRNPEYHTELFTDIKNSLFPRTKVFDMTGKDISRACYLPYDPGIFINTDPGLEEYQFTHDPSFRSPSSMSQPKTVSERFEHTPEERERHKWYEMICSDKTLMNKMIRTFNAANPDYYKDGNRHKEVLRRATLYCKNGVLYENAVTSLVGQFGEKSRASLKNADIESMVNSCYNKARGEFGVSRATFLKKKNSHAPEDPKPL